MVAVSSHEVHRVPDATLRRMLEIAALVRVIDEQMMELHREGRLPFYVNADPASHLPAAALRDADWIFPSHREHAVWLWRGYPIERFVDQLLGTATDPSKGRQLPTLHSARWLNLVSISSPPGTQIPQAVGVAQAARLSGRDDVALVYFGDGAAASPELHVALNFAGVWQAPCVFWCRTAGPALPRMAIGYGIPGVRVDARDATAVWQVATDAIARARAGHGPTFVEAQTPVEPADVLAGLRELLRERELWTEAWEHELVERMRRQLVEAIAAASAQPAPAVSTLFDDVYEHLPSHLRDQRNGSTCRP
jgi:TPP-dependent pyruvate/acetoin dehydrogenase alpha subunit